MDTKSIATIAGAAAAGGVLAFAGLSLASAATGSGHVQTPAAQNGQYPGMGGPMGHGGPGMGHRGTPVTGETADQATAAVQAKYPDATVLGVEEEDGGYEAHVRKADGTVVHVIVDKDFQVTGEHEGPPMGMGGPGMDHGTAVTGETADKVTAAVQAKYADATVLFVEEEVGGYEAHVRKADGTMVHITVDKDFQITGEHQGPPNGPGMAGPGGKGPHGEKPLKGAKAKKVTSAAQKRFPDGTVIRVETDPDGVYEAHVIKVDGKPVIVEVGKRFQVTGVSKMPARAPMGQPPSGSVPQGQTGAASTTGA